MGLETFVLLSLSFSVIIGVPLYIYFREKSISQAGKRKLTGLRVFKLTAINLLLNLFAALHLWIIFVTILTRNQTIETGIIISSILFILITWLTFYGNGIYIASIVLEIFTLPSLKKIKAFQTQFIATHLFHGLISHIIIYSGWILALLLLSVIDLLKPLESATLLTNWLLLAGGTVGVIYAIAQIYNGTALYQFITGLISFVIFVTIVSLNRVLLAHSPVAIYFTGIISIFNLSLLFYFVYLKIKGKKVYWYKYG